MSSLVDALSRRRLTLATRHGAPLNPAASSGAIRPPGPYNPQHQFWPLTPGTRLGPYEILSALGAGGMGEVYRARDTRLDRDIAIKILPEAFTADAERVARFQREAKVLASLNHPNIATIHGLEQADGAHALVMELVEGEDLAISEDQMGNHVVLRSTYRGFEMSLAANGLRAPLVRNHGCKPHQRASLNPCGFIAT